MAVVGIVLKVLLWVLVALLALLVLALFLPITADFRYDEQGARLRVGALLLRFTLFPRKQKSGGKKRAKKAKKKKKQPVEKKLTLTLQHLKQILPIAGGSVRRALWALRVHHININLPLHGEDAAKTAIQVGQMQAVLGAGFGFLQNFLHLQCQKVEIWADYHGKHKQEAFFSCKITAQLYIMCIVGVWALLQWRRIPVESV